MHTFSTSSASGRAFSNRLGRLGLQSAWRGAALAGLLCVLCFPVRAFDQVHRCKSSSGRISFQAQPCAEVAPTVGAAASPAEPRALEPAPTKPAAKRWASDADVILVSGNEASAQVTQVDIAHKARPVLLVLTSYQRMEWKVVPAPGTRIKAIVVTSTDGSRTGDVQGPPQVPVLVDQLPHAFAAGNVRFRALLTALNERYGVERLLEFRGGRRLPPVVSISGPFVPDPALTLEGFRPEVPALRFNFDLLAVDGRRLPFSNTGPRDGKRYAGVVRGGMLSSVHTKPVVVGNDGREAYYLAGNGGDLVWAPDGLNGRTEKVPTPPGIPPLSWASSLAWDTHKGILAIVSFGGEGYFYRYDTRKRKWIDARSLQNRDLHSLAWNPASGDYVALSDTAELFHFTGRGELDEVQPLDQLLPELNSTYDRSKPLLNSLLVAADGPATAVINVRNGTVTHIWTYDQRTRKGQLTYKIIE